ncbi:MAG: hypothetical protein KatS3mg060_3065 [Dehalococcoidia bacterium]|nr:MAG: hypothetical protein KatS3mg060_3065 [Dehalococcoidia bacterium]
MSTRQQFVETADNVVICNGVVDLLPLPPITDEVGRPEHAQMMGDRGDGVVGSYSTRQLTNVEFLMRKKMENRDACRVAERLEHIGQTPCLVVLAQGTAFDPKLIRHHRSQFVLIRDCRGLTFQNDHRGKPLESNVSRPESTSLFRLPCIIHRYAIANRSS